MVVNFSSFQRLFCVIGWMFLRAPELEGASSPGQEIFRLPANYAGDGQFAGDHAIVSTGMTRANAHSGGGGAKGGSAHGLDAFSTTTSSSMPLFPGPRNFTVLTTSLDPDGKAYVQLTWLPPVSPPVTVAPTSRVISGTSGLNHPVGRTTPLLGGTGVLPVDRYRISWHQQQHPKEEFRKSVDGDTTSYTIEHLSPNTYVVVELQAFRWLDDKKLRSHKVTTIVRTAARKSAYDAAIDAMSPASDSSSAAALFPLSDQNITILSVYYQNGLVKANLTWTAQAESPDTPYVIRWYPKVCLGDVDDVRGKQHHESSRLLVKPLLTTTNVNNVVVYDLNFNCRYAIAIYQRLDEPAAARGVTERLRGVKHFITPMCQDVLVVGPIAPNCPKLPPRLPGPPQNLSCLFLVQMTEISATCSWEAPLNSEQSIIGYRTMYARKMIDAKGLYGIHPFPLFDRNSFIMKVLDDDEMSFSVANLAEETEYIVYIQAVSAAGFGVMAKLEFITPRLIHSAAALPLTSRTQSPPPFADSPRPFPRGKSPVNGAAQADCPLAELCRIFFTLFYFCLASLLCLI